VGQILIKSLIEKRFLDIKINIRNRNLLRGEGWMKKLVATFILISLMLVLSSCSMEQKFDGEGHQYPPEGVEKKH
jgi:hypothetical protein